MAVFLNPKEMVQIIPLLQPEPGPENMLGWHGPGQQDWIYKLDLNRTPTTFKWNLMWMLFFPQTSLQFSTQSSVHSSMEMEKFYL